MKTQIFVVFLIFHQITAQDCVYKKTNNTGVCKKLDDCPSAIRELKQSGLPQTCSFENGHPVVCCENNVPTVLVPIEPTEPMETTFRLAKQKCDDYAKISATIPKIPIDPTGIVGGYNTLPGEIPHMAGLGYGNTSNIHWQCGGTLISEKYVLTAAHCLTHPEYGTVKFVRMGDIQLEREWLGKKIIGKNREDFGVQRAIIHPEYKRPSTYHDIALLELNKTVKFNSEIQPACLYTNPNLANSTHSSNMCASGWGLTQFGGTPSDVLQAVYLDYFSNEDCRKTFGINKRRFKDGIREDIQICAGGKDKDADTCQGDSGGPLQFLNYYQKPIYMHFVVGVTAFGKSCGTQNVPGVYTKVSNYLDWIEEIVWK